MAYRDGICFLFFVVPILLCHGTGMKPAVISWSWYGKIGLVMYLVAHYYVCIKASNHIELAQLRSLHFFLI